MDYNEEQQKLSEYTRKFSENFFKFLTALKIEEIISHFSEEINESKYTYFFSYLQIQSTEQLLLSLSKMYDTDSNSISIHSMINYIESNRRKLPALGWNQHENKILDFDFDQYKEHIIEKTENGQKVSTKINDKFVPDLIKSLRVVNTAHISNLEIELKSIKKIRDEQIAHIDKKVSNYTNSTWDDIEKLSVYPRCLLELVEDIFLATDTSYTKMEYLSLFEMLQELHIINNELKYLDVFDD